MPTSGPRPCSHTPSSDGCGPIPCCPLRHPENWCSGVLTVLSIYWPSEILTTCPPPAGRPGCLKAGVPPAEACPVGLASSGSSSLESGHLRASRGTVPLWWPWGIMLSARGGAGCLRELRFRLSPCFFLRAPPSPFPAPRDEPGGLAVQLQPACSPGAPPPTAEPDPLGSRI